MSGFYPVRLAMTDTMAEWLVEHLNDAAELRQFRDEDEGLKDLAFDVQQVAEGDLDYATGNPDYYEVTGV